MVQFFDSHGSPEGVLALPFALLATPVISPPSLRSGINTA